MRNKASYYRAEELRAANEERFEDAARWRDMREALENGPIATPADPTFSPQGIAKELAADGLKVKHTYGEESLSLNNRPTVDREPIPDHILDLYRAPKGDHHLPSWKDGLEAALRKALSEAAGYAVSEQDIIRHGFRIIDRRTGIENYYFDGRCIFVVDHRKGVYGKPKLDDERP